MNVIIRCPKCGLAISAPAGAERPEEGATCSWGHEPTQMLVAQVKEPGRG